MLKRIVSIILSVAMLASFSAVTAFADASSVEADKAALTESSLLLAPLTEDGCLMDSLSLPSVGTNGSVITWQSSDTSVITASGAVIRPVSQDKTVTLTAAISDGDITDTKSFTFKVPALSSQPAGTPKLAGAVVVDEFEDSVIDTSHIIGVAGADGNSCVEADGALKLTRSVNSGDTKIQLKGLNHTDYFTNGLYVEYVLSKTVDTDVFTRSYDTEDWNCINAIDWLGGGKIRYRVNGVDSTLDPEINTEYNLSKYNMKMALYVDLASRTQSIWINNIPVVQNQAVAMADCTNLAGFRYMQLYMQDTAFATLSVESYKLYSVAGAVPGANELPTVLGESLVIHNFDSSSDAVTNATISNSTASVSNTASATSNKDMYIYNDTAKSTIGGVVGVDFTITRSVNKPAAIYLYNNTNGGAPCVSLDWYDSTNSTNTFCFTAKKTAPTDSGDSSKEYYYIQKDVISNSEDSIKFTFLLDTRSGKFVAYANGVRLGSYYARRGCTESELAFYCTIIRAKSAVNAAVTLTVDDYRVYNALPATLDRLDFDMVDFDKFTVAETVNNDLTLPANLTYGSNVAWVSDNTAAIANDGTITRAAEDVTVNLTATVSNSISTPVTKQYSTVVKADNTSYSIAVGTGDTGSYTADFYATKDDGKHADAVYVIALYSGTELAGIKTSSVPDGEYENEVFASESFTASEIPQNADNITAKAFIWQKDNAKPLCEVLPVTAS